METENLRNENRTKPAEEIIPQLSPEVRENAYLVGAWIWVEFSSKPKSGTIQHLKELGFRWNSTRKVWQHTGGVFRPNAPYDPRMKYGRTSIRSMRQDEELN